MWGFPRNIRSHRRHKNQLPSREKIGIPGEKFVFCNFSRIAKIGPKTFEVCSR